MVIQILNVKEDCASKTERAICSKEGMARDLYIVISLGLNLASSESRPFSNLLAIVSQNSLLVKA